MLAARMLVLLLLAMAAGVAHGAERDDRVWPVSNTSRPLAMSSPFGPRLKASESFRVDFHRGVDIPTPLRTPVVACDDGTVRLSGLYPGVYSDMVIQVRHSWDGGNVYTTYLHMNETVVAEDEDVVRGQLLGYSGATRLGEATQFDHLHFETRVGSVFQRYNQNPFKFLPYSDGAEALRVSIDAVERLGGRRLCVNTTVSQAATELDLQRVELRYVKRDGSMVNRTTFDMHEINAATPVPSDLDRTTFGKVRVLPGEFRVGIARASYAVDFLDVELPAGATGITLVARDVLGNEFASSTETLESSSASYLHSSIPAVLALALSLTMTLFV